jgi:hypothetical protein
VRTVRTEFAFQVMILLSLSKHFSEDLNKYSITIGNDVILILFKFGDTVRFDIFYFLYFRPSRCESTPSRDIPSPPNRSSS